MNDSPWAVTTEAIMDDPADVREPAAVAPPMSAAPNSMPGQTTSSNGGMRWDGGITRNRRGHLATIPVLVRWDSASIMRKALERKSDADLPGADTVADHFVLTIIGLFPARQLNGGAKLQPKSSSDDSAGKPDTEETLEWFMTHSHLLVKGAAALEPQNVKINAETGAVHISFKRLEDLTQHKRELLFQTRYGSMSVQARFRVKDMVLEGQPDL